MITQELLKEHFEYRDGHLWWVSPRSNSVKIGQQFGCYDKYGYRTGILKSKDYKVRHLDIKE